MMRVSFHQFHQNGINAITDQQSSLAHTQLQLATQKRVLTPSEDPVASVSIQSFKTQIAMLERYKQNSEAVKGYNESEEVLLQQSTNIVQRVRDLLLQAGNGNYTVQERNALANEVEERLKELLGVANTQNAQGEYVFAGFKSDVMPFVRTPGGVYVYQGDQGQRRLNTSSNVSVAISDSGFDVYQNVPTGNGDFTVTANVANTGTGVMSSNGVVDRATYVADTYTTSFSTGAAGQLQYTVTNSAAVVVSGPLDFVENEAISFNGVTVRIDGVPAVTDTFVLTPSTKQDIFTSIETAIAAMRSNTQMPADYARMRQSLDQSLEHLDQGLNNFARIHAEVGTRLNVVQSETESNLDAQVQNKSILSNLEDLDMVDAISRLQQQTTALEAAQQSYVKIQGLTLFNYL